MLGARSAIRSSIPATNASSPWADASRTYSCSCARIRAGAGDVVDLAEMGDGERLRRPALDQVDRPIPRLDVDVRRGVGAITYSLGGMRTPAMSPTNAVPVGRWR